MSWMHYNFNSSISYVKRCFSNCLELTEGIIKNIEQCEEFIHRYSRKKCCSGLLRGVMKSPPPEVFKRYVDVVLTGMI